MSRDFRLYLDDMIEAVRRILLYTADLDYEQFIIDTKTYDAVMRNLTVLGEAARNIPTDVRQRHPDVPWAKAIGMRSIVVHEYPSLSNQIIWQTIQSDLPPFLEQILHVLEVEDAHSRNDATKS